MKNLYLLLIAFLASATGFAQTTIAIQDFETPSGTPAMTYTTNGQGSTYNGISVSPNNSFSANNDNAILTFSGVNTSNFNTVSLEFRLGSYRTNNDGADNGDTVLLEISPNNGTNWYSQVLVRGNSNAGWQYGTGLATASKAYAANQTFSTFAPTGGGARTTDGYSTVRVTGLPSVTQLRTRITLLNNNNDEYWFIDDVKIIGTANCTTTPINVTALTATPTSQQVTLNWTNSTCFDEVLVVAKASTAVTAVPTGNGSAYTANATFGSGTAIATGEFVVFKGTGATVNVTALTNGTTYHFKVFTRKGTNWSSGVVANATPAVTGYCTATGTNNNFEYISNFQLNTINNTSTGNLYTYYSAISTDLLRGSQYNVSITVTWPTANQYNEGYGVWIDFNQNGVFTDPGERVFTQSLTQTRPVTGTIVVPADAVLGTTRMRVVMVDQATQSPCGTITYGEVEDYNVKILPSTTYTYNNGWSPSSPIGVSTSANDIIVANGTAVFTASTQSKSIVVNPTGAVTVNSGVTLSSANGMTLQSNSTQYSSLLLNGTVTGTVNYNRHVNAQSGFGVGSGGNDLISAPLTGQTFASFVTANPNLRADVVNNTDRKLFGPFNKTTGTYDLWINTVAQQSNNTLNAGVGYRSATNDPLNNSGFVFTGTANKGVITNNILNSGPQFEAYNLIGNPYASYINVREFLEYDVEPGASVVRNIDLMDTYGAIYGYDGNTAGVGNSGWIVYNLTTATTVNMTPGQGFMVTADAADVAAYDMTFTPSMRRIGNTDDFIPGRLANENNVHVKLHAVMGTDNFNTDIFFNDNATSGLDFGYDASIFNSSAPAKAMYSHLVENNSGIDLAIQALAYSALGTDIVVPIGINVPQGQQVTVSIAESDLPSNIEVYLEDIVTGTFTLLNTNEYVFTATTNLNETGRFFLRFADQTLSTPDAGLNQLQIYATASPKALFIKGYLTSATEIQIYDVQGRLVMSSQLEASSNTNQLDVSNLNTGVYIVKLNNKSQQKTQKVILR